MRVVEVHDAARARKEYAVSDALRHAFDCTYPFETTPAERAASYAARFDVSTTHQTVNFVSTPPAT
jgi:hypothetical protein